MVAKGAHVEDISVLLGPAVSGRNYEVPDAMADEVEAALPGSRTTTARGTAGLDLRVGNRPAADGIWASRRSTSTRAARSTTRTCSAIGAPRRPDGWPRWCGWNDAPRAQTNSPRPWPRCGHGSTTRPRPPGRDAARNRTAARHEVLSGVRRRRIGATRMRRLRRIARTGGVDQGRRSGGRLRRAPAPNSLAHDRQHSAQEGARGRGVGVRRALGGRRCRSSRRWAGRRPRRSPRAGGPSRCGSTSS